MEALINDKHRRGGIGFQFSRDDPYFGVDQDNCRDLQTGEIKPWAQQVLDLLGPTYTEVSPSGTGLHSVAKGQLPPGGRKHTRVDGGVIEMYDQGRYFTLTGNRLPGAPAEINDCQSGLNKLHAKLFPAKPKTKPTKPAPTPTEPLSLSDAEVIERACNCRKTGVLGNFW